MNPRRGDGGCLTGVISSPTLSYLCTAQQLSVKPLHPPLLVMAKGVKLYLGLIEVQLCSVTHMLLSQEHVCDMVCVGVFTCVGACTCGCMYMGGYRSLNVCV